jgi:hypothetical protein
MHTYEVRDFDLPDPVHAQAPCPDTSAEPRATSISGSPAMPVVCDTTRCDVRWNLPRHSGARTDSHSHEAHVLEGATGTVSAVRVSEPRFCNLYFWVQEADVVTGDQGVGVQRAEDPLLVVEQLAE